MDAIERAIRSALERGDAADRAFREKVYRQAFGALERALQSNPSLTVEAAIRRRKALQAKITEIEAAYIPAAPRAADVSLSDIERELGIDPADMRMPPVAPPARHVEPARAQPAPARPEPARPAPRAPAPQQEFVRPEPAFEDSDTIPLSDEIVVEADGPTPVVPDIMMETPRRRAPAPEAAEVRGEMRKPPRRRRPVIWAFIGITALCIAVVLGYGAQQMGLLGGNAARQQDLADSRTPPTAESEDFEPGAEGDPATAGAVDPQRDWIAVFDPNDPSTVSAPGDAKAETMRDSAGPFIRLTSGQSGSAILFDVGQGVLERIAGKRATFDIVARAQDGTETQMSVACNFGELGDCGRKRYAVGAGRADYLFEIDVPKAEPGAGGTIAVNSDFANTGKSVDVFAIRVSVVPVPASN